MGKAHEIERPRASTGDAPIEGDGYGGQQRKTVTDRDMVGKKEKIQKKD